METLEDSVGTVRIDQGMGEKTVSDSLKIGIADDGDCLQRQLLAIHEELGKRLNNTPYIPKRYKSQQCTHYRQYPRKIGQYLMPSGITHQS